MCGCGGDGYGKGRWKIEFVREFLWMEVIVVIGGRGAEGVKGVG